MLVWVSSESLPWSKDVQLVVQLGLGSAPATCNALKVYRMTYRPWPICKYITDTLFLFWNPVQVHRQWSLWKPSRTFFSIYIEQNMPRFSFLFRPLDSHSRFRSSTYGITIRKGNGLVERISNMVTCCRVNADCLWNIDGIETGSYRNSTVITSLITTVAVKSQPVAQPWFLYRFIYLF